MEFQKHLGFLIKFYNYSVGHKYIGLWGTGQQEWLTFLDNCTNQLLSSNPVESSATVYPYPVDNSAAVKSSFTLFNHTKIPTQLHQSHVVDIYFNWNQVSCYKHGRDQLQGNICMNLKCMRMHAGRVQI